MPDTPLLNHWTEDQIARVGKANLIARHRLHEMDLFTDEGLLATLERHPLSALGVSTMGTDPAKREEWRDGTTGGHDAATLLDAVKNGHLWLNLRRVADHHPEYKRLIDDLYDELESITPGLHTYNRSGNLLISSPSAIVYLHVDCPVNMLWHIRGEKRAFVYPIDDRVVTDAQIENVVSGTSVEEIDYHPEMDKLAEAYDLVPGDLVTWAQHTPHRVVNTSGLNISLSTEHMTRAAARRNNVYLANRYFKDTLGWEMRSTKTTGLGAAAKEFAIRVARRLPVLGAEDPVNDNYSKTFDIDPSAPNGYRLYDEPPALAPAGAMPLAGPAVAGDLTTPIVVDSPLSV